MKNLKNNKNAEANFIGIFIVLLLIAGGITLDLYIGFTGETDVKDTVLNHERVVKTTNGKTESYYLVHGQNETYQITDSWLKGRFNSSDVYGHILDGHTYTFHVIGIRVPILSHYRNIMIATEIK